MTAARADVVVVGAGPAGVATAVALAKAGRDVMVLDRSRFPRDKCCGDGLTTGALRALEDLGLDPSSLPSWLAVEDVVVRGPAGHAVRFPLPRDRGTYAAIVRRVELDAALVDLARREGATVLDGHALVGARTGAGRLTVEVDGLGDVTARYAVGADGMWSPLRKAMAPQEGPRGYLGEWHAFRQYFTGVGPKAARELHVLFEADLLPGYAWSFPLAGGVANLGFGIQRDGRLRTGTMAELWADILRRESVRDLLGADAQPEGPHRAWPIPARVERLPLVAGEGRVLFVGDAAGVADPLTGEGIGQALLTGRLAAEAILAAGALEPEAVGRRYRNAVHRELAPDDAMSRLLIRAVRHRRGVRAGLRVAGAMPWTRRNFARWLFEDYPRALVVTPGRWHRHGMSGPGTFTGASPARNRASVA